MSKSILVAFFALCATSALAGTQIDSRIYVPGYGKVLPSSVCLKANGSGFLLAIPARDVKTCTGGETVTGNASAREVTCWGEKIVHQPARVLSAPLSYTAKVCVKSHGEDDTQAPHQTRKLVCDQYGTSRVVQPLTYTVRTGQFYDFESGTANVSEERIPYCAKK